MKAVSTKKNTRIKMRFESINFEKLFHMLSGLNPLSCNRSDGKEKVPLQNYKNS